MRGWVILLIVLVGLYAAYHGYIPGGEYLRYAEKKIKDFLPESSVLNPKETEMRTYPVSVSYQVVVVNSKIYGKYDLKIKYYNHGSESVTFIMDPPVIVDSSGNTYRATLGIFDFVTIYPGAKAVKTYHFNRLPSVGNLYIDIYTPGDQPNQVKKAETLKMRFELKG